MLDYHISKMERNEPNPSGFQQFARVLSIAGSDSGGCAGIQADLKTFAALQVHGMCAITSVTAQDTQRVHARFDLPEDLITRQIEVVTADIGVDAVKTGMLATAGIIRSVAETLERLEIKRLVVDPVMVSTGGDRLADENAISQMISRLFPLASVVTPNLPEAEVLVGSTLETSQDLENAARTIKQMGPESVVIKGGHRNETGISSDLYWDGLRFEQIADRRIETKNTHGSGCTYSAAIAAYLAQDVPLLDAVRKARVYVQKAILKSYDLGRGNGPLGIPDR